MDFDIFGIAGIVVTVVLMTIISSHWQRAALDKKLKKDDLKAIFASLGLKNFRAEDFNKLTPEGIKNLCTFVTTWKQSDNPLGQFGNFDINKYLGANPFGQIEK